MIFRHSVPILYSSDIRKSIEYYMEVLGFDSKWEWDDPPTFGGVNKDAIQLFFCKNGQGQPGTWVAIMVDNVDELYERVKSKRGKILSAPEDKEWGLREMLVQDPDEHVIRFGQGVTHDRKKSGELLASIKIIDRMPTIEEYQSLTKAVEWNVKSKEQTEMILKAPLFAAVAEDSETNTVVGCVLLLGDNVSFYYVKDMMVHPDFQNKQVGSALMLKLNEWIKNNAPDDVLVGLYTGENLALFYKQFGFKESFGMTKRIGKKL
jgi:GNAT superfamily N-acetyltransferase/catechol 2,3-dioxygenase-like lactoylglutathione lyase family enzyme